MTDTTASTERSMMRAYRAVNEAGLTDQGALYLLGYLIAAAPKTAMADLDRLRARTVDDPAARRRFFTDSDSEGPESMTTIDEATLQALPPGVHATVLADRDPNQTLMERIVVWADPLPTCPRCLEPVGERGVPVQLNGKAAVGGAIESRNLQHGCGEWISQLWVVVDEVAQVPERAADLASDRGGIIAAETARIRRDLTQDLASVLERLAEGEDPDGVATGSDRVPGVYRDSEHGWVAWDYAANEGRVTVYASDVRAAENRGA